MRNNLKKIRLLASKKSGGTSDLDIKVKIIYYLKKFTTKNKSLLDFGSGKGELISELLEKFNFKNMAGADLYQRLKKINKLIIWHQLDLNNSFAIKKKYDFVICSETIEHLENPRHTLRTVHRAMKNNGILILTMPNNESLRGIGGLIFGGHFSAFLGSSYPAHITPILKLDLIRICSEIGFKSPLFAYTDSGKVPKFPGITWQKISFGLLQGKYFSDTLVMVVKK
jgi:2-polyprenyl-3-methyl-5-hydroxy-6-metoxy-1,4-benzoquinol methylase